MYSLVTEKTKRNSERLDTSHTTAKASVRASGVSSVSNTSSLSSADVSDDSSLLAVTNATMSSSSALIADSHSTDAAATIGWTAPAALGTTKKASHPKRGLAVGSPQLPASLAFGSTLAPPRCDSCEQELDAIGPMIECAECPARLCFDCLCYGVEFDTHKKFHRYRILPKLWDLDTTDSKIATVVPLTLDDAGKGIDNAMSTAATKTKTTASVPSKASSRRQSAKLRLASGSSSLKRKSREKSQSVGKSAAKKRREASVQMEKDKGQVLGKGKPFDLNEYWRLYSGVFRIYGVGNWTQLRDYMKTKRPVGELQAKLFHEYHQICGDSSISPPSTSFPSTASASTTTSKSKLKLKRGSRRRRESSRSAARKSASARQCCGTLRLNAVDTVAVTRSYGNLSATMASAVGADASRLSELRRGGSIDLTKEKCAASRRATDGRHIKSKRKSAKKKKSRSVEQIAETLDGYNLHRYEFDIEWQSEAEADIGAVDFDEFDSHSELDLKMEALRLYNDTLVERKQRVDLILNFGAEPPTFAIKNEWKSVLDVWAPFARFAESERMFKELVTHVVLEEEIRTKAQRLFCYALNGVRSMESVVRLEKLYAEYNRKAKVKRKAKANGRSKSGAPKSESLPPSDLGRASAKASKSSLRQMSKTEPSTMTSSLASSLASSPLKPEASELKRRRSSRKRKLSTSQASDDVSSSDKLVLEQSQSSAVLMPTQNKKRKIVGGTNGSERLGHGRYCIGSERKSFVTTGKKKSAFSLDGMASTLVSEKIHSLTTVRPTLDCVSMDDLRYFELNSRPIRKNLRRRPRGSSTITVPMAEERRREYVATHPKPTIDAREFEDANAAAVCRELGLSKAQYDAVLKDVSRSVIEYGFAQANEIPKEIVVEIRDPNKPLTDDGNCVTLAGIAEPQILRRSAKS